MSTTTEADSADLGTELYQTDRHTLGDGRVRGRIQSVADDGDTITVEIMALTTRETFSERYDKPRSWSRSNEFVRLVEWCDYGPASAMQLEGCEVPIRDEEHGYALDFEKLPGEGVVDNIDYYRGVWRGMSGILLFLAGIFIVARVTTPLAAPFSPGGIMAAVGFATVVIIGLFFLVWYLIAPEGDDRDTLSFSEVQYEDPLNDTEPSDSAFGDLE